MHPVHTLSLDIYMYMQVECGCVVGSEHSLHPSSSLSLLMPHHSSHIDSEAHLHKDSYALCMCKYM